MVFSSSRKMAQQTSRRLIAGHFTLVAWWTLRHAGVLEAMVMLEGKKEGAGEGGGLDPLVHATKTNMDPEVLAAMLEYLSQAGLVMVSAGRVKLTAEGRGLLDHEDGVLQLVKAYEPVLEASEHLLAKLKVFGGTACGGGAGSGNGNGAPYRKAEYLVEAQAKRFATEVFGAVTELVKEMGSSHVLDVSCGSGDLLVQLARENPRIVGVGIGAEGSLVRRANAAIAKADLEQRLLAVTADPLEACAETRRTFDRIGVSRQLWNEIDCIIATGVFSELAARGQGEAETRAAVGKALAATGKNFPKARLMLIEPVASERFARNYYAAELALLLRLTRTVPWPAETWRDLIAGAKMSLVREVGLTTDGLSIFLCKPLGIK